MYQRFKTGDYRPTPLKCHLCKLREAVPLSKVSKTGHLRSIGTKLTGKEYGSPGTLGYLFKLNRWMVVFPAGVVFDMSTDAARRLLTTVRKNGKPVEDESGEGLDWYKRHWRRISLRCD